MDLTPKRACTVQPVICEARLWKDRYLDLQKRFDAVSKERDRLSAVNPQLEAVNRQLNQEVDRLRAELFRLLDADRSKLHNEQKGGINTHELLYHDP